jgi:hypothetical protein
MNIAWLVLAIFVGVGIGVWLASLVVEALRPVPAPPGQLRWATEIPILYVDAGGCKLRYIKAGLGPNLVLLHTLRTQLANGTENTRGGQPCPNDLGVR